MIDLAQAAGKYGAYIWPAYGVSVAGIVALVLDTAARSRRWRREVEQRREGFSANEPDTAEAPPQRGLHPAPSGQSVPRT